MWELTAGAACGKIFQELPTKEGPSLEYRLLTIPVRSEECNEFNDATLIQNIVGIDPRSFTLPDINIEIVYSIYWPSQWQC